MIKRRQVYKMGFSGKIVNNIISQKEIQIPKEKNYKMKR